MNVKTAGKQSRGIGDKVVMYGPCNGIDLSLNMRNRAELSHGRDISS